MLFDNSNKSSAVQRSLYILLTDFGIVNAEEILYIMTINEIDK